MFWDIGGLQSSKIWWSIFCILYVPWNLGPKQCWTPKLHKFQPFVPHWCVAFCGSKTSIETRISISSMSATPLFVRTAPAERPTHPKDVDDNNISRQVPFWWSVVSLACRIRVLDVDQLMQCLFAKLFSCRSIWLWLDKIDSKPTWM